MLRRYLLFILAASVGLAPAPVFADIRSVLDDLMGFLSGQGKPTDCPPTAKTQPIRQTPKPLPPLHVKKEDELDRYVNCYLIDPGGLSAYREYEPYIKTAAREFGIPRTVFTCLLFRESRFNKDNVSHTGALGLGQFTTDTANYISNIIAARKMSESKVRQYIELADNPIKLTGDKSRDKEAKKSRQLAEDRLAYVELASKWDNYFTTLRSLKKYPNATPGKFRKSDARTPVLAIGAAALYLRHIMDILQEQIVKKVGADAIPPKRNRDLLLTAVGAYNLGHNRALTLGRESRSSDAKDWVAQLRNDKDETAGHIDSIANCIASPEHQAEMAYEPMRGDDKADCSKPRQSKPKKATGGQIAKPKSPKRAVSVKSGQANPKSPSKSKRSKK